MGRGCFNLLPLLKVFYFLLDCIDNLTNIRLIWPYCSCKFQKHPIMQPCRLKKCNVQKLLKPRCYYSFDLGWIEFCKTCWFNYHVAKLTTMELALHSPKQSLSMHAYPPQIKTGKFKFLQLYMPFISFFFNYI